MPNQNLCHWVFLNLFRLLLELTLNSEKNILKIFGEKKVKYKVIFEINLIECWNWMTRGLSKFACANMVLKIFFLYMCLFKKKNIYEFKDFQVYKYQEDHSWTNCFSIHICWAKPSGTELCYGPQWEIEKDNKCNWKPIPFVCFGLRNNSRG